jgi:UDP-N-acetyl-D-mannosaminuronate dehydrogenase
LTFDEHDVYLKENDVTQVLVPTPLKKRENVKIPNAFRDILKQIKKNNRGSTMNIA